MLSNLDASIIAQAPKMMTHIPAMRENIAADLSAPYSAVNVKAKTCEKLGFLGRSEGIACEVVVLLVQAREPESSSVRTEIV